jgi:hypothetical protein
MAVDLEAIRRKVQQLQGNRSSSNVQFWKVDPGEYSVRAVPWPASMLKDGQPFVERYFYYIGENRGILSPEQFGKEDPIAELRMKLYKTNDPADREIAKKLRSKMRCYLAVIERGKEDEGIKIWSFGKLVYQRLLGFFLDEEIGDWMDPKEGFDLKVKITKKADSQWRDTVVDPARRQSALAKSDDDIAKLCSSVPSIDDVYKQKSTEEIESVLNGWLNGGETEENDGASRNAGGNDALDDLVKEVKGATEAKAAPAEEKPVEKKTRKKKAAAKKTDDADLDALASETAPPTKSLNAAFDELMKDDD